MKFKGSEFLNRYRITGQLTTLSPLHIGDGERLSNDHRLPKTDKMKKDPEFSTVMTDISGKAYIPGSTLKGCLRSWIEQIFSHTFFGPYIAMTNAPERSTYLQDFIKNIEEKKKKASELHKKLALHELLFGSSVNEGKLEFWDAPMVMLPKTPDQPVVYNHYDPNRGTIILKSVAIDPVSGTAAKNKLFNYEVVPKGIIFDVTISGQNIENSELGMIMFAMQGFNSSIFPVTLGAMSGIGFGRCKFVVKDIYTLNQDNFEQWVQEANKTDHAGYSSLIKLTEIEQKECLNNFKGVFEELIKKGV